MTVEEKKEKENKQFRELNAIKKVLNIFLVILSIYILYILKQFFIPIALALFFAVLLIPILSKMVEKKLPLGLSIATVSLAFLGMIFLFGLFISKMASRLINESGELRDKIAAKFSMIQEGLSKFGGGYFEEKRIEESLENIINPDFIFQYTGDLAGFVGGFTTDFFLMFLYMVGFLSAIQNYKMFLIYLFGGKSESGNTRVVKIFEELKVSLSKYMGVKILISFGTGACYAIACYAFGIKHAIIWGFLAFCLNFIPTLGSIIATVPPLLLSLIQFDSLLPIVFFFAVMMSIQFFFGNILEPKIQGSSFNINFVSIILGLVLFGGLWGIIGMLLSVPLLVLLKIILSQIPEARIIVRLMSTNREIKEWAEKHNNISKDIDNEIGRKN